MSMDVELDGLFRQNGTYDYGDYEYKEESEPVDSTAVLIPLIFSVEMVIGLLGNGLLLAVLAQKRRSWSISDTFILHQSVSDILLLLLTLPIWAAQAVQRCRWCHKGFVCKISGAVFNVNFYCGIFLLVCICVDRYLSIVRGTQLYSQRRPMLAHISCLLVWIGSLILSIPGWVFMVAKKDQEEEKTFYFNKNCQSAPQRLLLSHLPHLTVGFLLPAAALIFCCSTVLRRLQRNSKGLQKQRFITLILPLVAVFLLCWIPYNITLLMNTVRSSSKKPSSSGNPEGSLKTALMVTSVLGCFHACLRPLLYLGLCQNFRKRALALLRCATIKSEDSLWDLDIGKEAPPDKTHEVGETEQLATVDHQVQLTQC